MMPNILIAEGTPSVWQAQRARFGLPANFSLFAEAVRLHRPEIRCTAVNIADHEALPLGATWSDFDGVMIPGSRCTFTIPRPMSPGRSILCARLLAPACRCGAAAGVCNWQPWRLAARSGAIRADANCRSRGPLR